MIPPLNRSPRVPVMARNDLSPLLEAATREVFQIMLGVELSQLLAMDFPLAADFTAMVGLAGELCGVLSLRCGADGASRMASKMLGTDVSELDNNVGDALGEICNIVAGSFKAKIAGMAEGCMLSVPTVITGADYRLHSLASGERTELCFALEAVPFWVTLDISP